QYYSLFIRCNSDGRKMHIPITIKSVDRFISSSSSKDLLLGTFYGILLTLTLFYFYLAYIIKEKPFLFLALYLLFLTLTQFAVGGIDYAYLWPNTNYLNNRSVPIFMGLAIIIGLYFALLFISKSISKWILWPFRILFSVGVLSVVLSFGSDQMLDFGMGILYYLIPLDYGLLFVVGAYYMLRKIKIARFFALSFFAATASIGLMVYYSINNNTDNVFTNNLVLYALIIKCVMLSIAMLDRVKIFKEENEKAQAVVIENLEEMTQIKESVNQELERKIQEKTSELLNKKNEINLALIQGEERERRRLAQELHDGLGSLLATLKLNVESLNLESKGLSAFEWKAYNGLLEMVDYACRELRDISHNMLPAGIEHFGLDATLKSDIQKLSKHKSLEVSLDTFGLKNIKNKEIELHVYRIVLELLNNVIKHANASKANIQLIMLDKHLSLILEDNGIGFNPEKTIHSGIGIISIKSRVEALSGKMQIDSMKDRGTSITIEIPVN
ncbi:MAG: ATP-binding protein, partial [Bacteroidia bacterium]|nr:ATP-binding protein [Bacteroidia bacterium]